MSSQHTGIQLELAWIRLLSVLEELAHFAVRGAFSPLLRESFAVTCALFDGRARLLAHSQTSSPSLVGVLSQVLAERLGTEVIAGSDNSWVEVVRGCPSTIVTIAPFEAQGFIACAAHMPEVTQDSALAVSMKEEALHGVTLHPSLKEEASVLLACNGLGIRRLQSLLQEWGITLPQLSDYIVQVSQVAILKKLSQLHLATNSSYDQEITIQTASDTAQRVKLTACVHPLTKGIMECELSATSPEAVKGSSAACCRAFAQFAFLTMFGPDVPANHGSLSIFNISMVPGSLLDMPRDEQYADASTIAYCLPDLIYGCFGAGAKLEGGICGTHPPAGSAGHLCCLQWRVPGGSPGIHILAGGTGAHVDQDGLSSTIFPSGFRSTPIEVTEQSLAGLVFKSKALIQDSGGAGCFRGGLGMRLVVSCPGDVSLSCISAFAADGPEGRHGGRPGHCGKGPLREGSGKTFVFETAGGGGFGPAAKRPRTAVLSDVRNGYVSQAAAVSDYEEAALGKRFGMTERTAPALKNQNGSYPDRNQLVYL